MRVFWDFKRAFMGTLPLTQDFPSPSPSCGEWLSSPLFSWADCGRCNTV